MTEATYPEISTQRDADEAELHDIPVETPAQFTLATDYVTGDIGIRNAEDPGMFARFGAANHSGDVEYAESYLTRLNDGSYSWDSLTVEPRPDDRFVDIPLEERFTAEQIAWGIKSARVALDKGYCEVYDQIAAEIGLPTRRQLGDKLRTEFELDAVVTMRIPITALGMDRDEALTAARATWSAMSPDELRDLAETTFKSGTAVNYREIARRS